MVFNLGVENKSPAKEATAPHHKPAMGYSLPPLKSNRSLNKSHSALFEAFLTNKNNRLAGQAKDKLVLPLKSQFTWVDSGKVTTAPRKLGITPKLSVNKIDMRFLT
jgi:hypothetical protein